MADLFSKFVFWYYNDFQTDPLYKNMIPVVENSPWHRERNVATHTDMVVACYLNFSDDTWDTNTLCGALACAFHDVGKPDAEEVIESKERGTYRRYAGHEKISARLWENYAASCWPKLVALFNLQPYDIYRVGYLVEKHLPFGLKNPQKRLNLFVTITSMFGVSSTFEDVLLADAYGRIPDFMEEKRQNVRDWIRDWNEKKWGDELIETMFPLPEGNKTLYIPIGASGCGKTTYINNIMKEYNWTENDLLIYSWDVLRLNWYIKPDETFSSEEEKYKVAFERQIKDNSFEKDARASFVECVKTGINIVVDNTNSSQKRRAFFINEARNHNYKVIAWLFPISLSKLIARQQSRSDKTVPVHVVTRHYHSLQLPAIGEFDHVKVVGDNLDR